MATVKIPESVVGMLLDAAVDALAGVIKEAVAEKTGSTKRVYDEPIEFPVGSTLRIRISPRGD